MITYFQALILGFMQGATELFPISSLGHSVILLKLFNWHIDQTNNFLLFLVATHLATSLVLFFFFFKDWTLIISGMFRSLKEREIKEEDVYAKLGWLIVVGTIPAGILGLLFEEKLKSFLALPLYASFFLVLNGVLLWAIEKYKKKKVSYENGGDERIAKMTWAQSVKIGFFQCLALIPGFSRTGSTLGGGLFIGLNHEDSARYSFLLATPIIFAAAVLKLPELINASTHTILGPLFVGSLSSALAAYLSVRFLSKYFKTKDLTPFAYYCILFGIICLFLL